MAKRHTKLDDVRTTVSGTISNQLREQFYTMCYVYDRTPAAVIGELVEEWTAEMMNRAIPKESEEESAVKTPKATAKQIKYINDLAAQRGEPAPETKDLSIVDANKLIQKYTRPF